MLKARDLKPLKSVSQSYRERREIEDQMAARRASEDARIRWLTLLNDVQAIRLSAAP